MKHPNVKLTHFIILLMLMPRAGNSDREEMDWWLLKGRNREWGMLAESNLSSKLIVTMIMHIYSIKNMNSTVGEFMEYAFI